MNTKDTITEALERLADGDQLSPEELRSLVIVRQMELEDGTTIFREFLKDPVYCWLHNHGAKAMGGLESDQRLSPGVYQGLSDKRRKELECKLIEDQPPKP